MHTTALLFNANVGDIVSCVNITTLVAEFKNQMTHQQLQYMELVLWELKWMLFEKLPKPPKLQFCSAYSGVDKAVGSHMGLLREVSRGASGGTAKEKEEAVVGDGVPLLEVGVEHERSVHSSPSFKIISVFSLKISHAL
ncbi:Cytochrome P450 11B1, mitochondrial [Frankliniella fusca]|uniref:Cytochrome P450 11B1, mitochondrial n=1 Tax=Frankliniella fusca TaxID=407009 RepID=A0AAE1LMK3_9NEOP|nr:Cytochrome P450 11B1, mitochondrial [Frankliniella fusca]